MAALALNFLYLVSSFLLTIIIFIDFFIAEMYSFAELAVYVFLDVLKNITMFYETSSRMYML